MFKGLNDVCKLGSSSEVASYRYQDVIGELEVKISYLSK